MKYAILCLAAVAQIALSAAAAVSAEPIQRIPLYYKRHNKQAFISTAAKDLENGMLGGTVQIGNPPQNLTMAFDTSTGFSWVRSTQCMIENCLGRRDFNPENSTSSVSTYHTFTLNYGEGVVNTTIYVDTFRYAGMTVEKMPFGSAYEMSGFNKGFDGYLGLGRDVNLNSSTTFNAKRDIPASGFVPNAFQQASGMQSAQFGMYTTSPGSGFSQSGSVASSDVVSSNAASSNLVSSNGDSSNGATSNGASSNGASNGVSNGASSNGATSNGATSNGAASSSPSSNAAPSNGPASNNQASNGASNTVSTGSVTPGGWGVFKRNNHQEGEPAGYLVLGGIDQDAIKGKLYHMKVVQEDNDSGSWAVRVNEAKFDDLYFQVNKKSKAVLSTATDVIGLPNKQAEQFRKHWYAEYDKPDNTFRIPCCLMDKLSSFKIQLDNVKTVIPPQYWSHPRQVDNCCEMCRTHIGKSGSDKDYVIGYSFTNAFYTSYDTSEDTISLGMKKNHVDDGLQLCDA